MRVFERIAMVLLAAVFSAVFAVALVPILILVAFDTVMRALFGPHKQKGGDW